MIVFPMLPVVRARCHVQVPLDSMLPVPFHGVSCCFVSVRLIREAKYMLREEGVSISVGGLFCVLCTEIV